MCNCNSEKGPDDLITRRKALKKCFIIAGGVLLSLVGIFMPSKKAEAGWGRCQSCSCPGFQSYGGSATCSNCGHPYSWHNG
jgi:hypothetical protein